MKILRKKSFEKSSFKELRELYMKIDRLYVVNTVHGVICEAAPLASFGNEGKTHSHMKVP